MSIVLLLNNEPRYYITHDEFTKRVHEEEEKFKRNHANEIKKSINERNQNLIEKLYDNQDRFSTLQSKSIWLNFK